MSEKKKTEPIFSESNGKQKDPVKKISKQQYSEMTKKASPNSKPGINCLLAFVFGGGICTIGQALCNWYVSIGLDIQSARAAVSVSLIFVTAVLTACKIYDNIAKHAGAGTLVPITGFANSMVSPALEFKTEGFVAGVGVKMFTIAGPVLVYGLSASIIYGIILWLIQMGH